MYFSIEKSIGDFMNHVKCALSLLICLFVSMTCFCLPAMSMNEDDSGSPSSSSSLSLRHGEEGIFKDSSVPIKPFSFVPKSRPFSILLIEEGENSLGIYDSETRKEVGRINLNFYPHEIEVSPDGLRAYVSNFGIRDYDMKIGYPGNSISIIDLVHFCEIDRLYTTFEGKNYWGPHGLKLHPNGQDLYVNVECVNSRFPSTNALQESMMLVFNLREKKVESLIFRPTTLGLAKYAYPLAAGTHNFVFAPQKDPEDEDFDMWYYAAANGVTCISSKTGIVKKHYPTNLESSSSSNSQAFNGAVRGLDFNKSGTSLLVSAKNELSVIDLSSESSGTSIEKFGNLGVGQLFYSKFIPGTNLVLAPAARESQVLVVDIGPEQRGQVIKRIVTGVDPLQVAMSPIVGEMTAYVTNADSPWVSELDLNSFEVRAKIPTKGGANGIAFSHFFPKPPASIIKLGVCLPFTGQYAAEGRECFLGAQFWQEIINGAGGVVVNGERYEVDICYEDTASITDERELERIFSKFLENHTSDRNNEGILTMFGTYPSSANLVLANVLAHYNIPMITSTGRDPSLFNRGLGNIFGISPLRKTSDLKDAFMAIYKHVSPKPRTAMVLSCKECDSCEEAQMLSSYLTQNGIKILSPFQIEQAESSPIITFSHCPAYQESTELRDLNALMAEISLRARENCQFYPDLLFVSGHRKEAAAIINSCAREDFTYGALALNVGATSHHFLTQISSPIENLLGSVCWSDTCSDFAEDRFVSSTDFQRMFYERYSENPSEHVAGFAASGIVIEEMLKKSRAHGGGIDFRGSNLISSLRSMEELTTFYGPIRFDSDGSNSKKPIITVQLRTLEGKLRGVPVWPSSIAGKESPKFPH
ncbi:MAG: hypothetical protein K2X28_08015 [Alphaproteobacteria bacterium]|nr:hypothetical protein [Alphaproteobacteria bacterium]